MGVGTPGSAGAGGLIRNANSTCLNGRPLQRDPDTARAAGAAGQRRQLPRAVRSDRRRRGGRAGRVRGHPRHRRRRRPRGQRRTVAGANGLAGEWGHNPPPWADADEYARRAALLLRPARLHRDLAQLARRWRRTMRHGGAVIPAAQIAQAAAQGDAACAASLERHASRLARAGDGDQPRRPGRDRPRRRAVAHREPVHAGPGALAAACLQRRRRTGAAHAARAEPAMATRRACAARRGCGARLSRPRIGAETRLWLRRPRSVRAVALFAPDARAPGAARRGSAWGGRRVAPTALRCSARGRVAKLAAFATLTTLTALGPSRRVSQ